jgi:solute carrier family 35 (GDP-fucose transporter), member C1
VFNTLCLREVEATFFQVFISFPDLRRLAQSYPQIARGLVLPLTIVVTPTKFHPRQAARVTIAAGLVTMGFFIGVIPEGNLPVSSIPPPRSLIFGVFSSLCIAVHSVLVKSSLSYCNNSTIQLAYWTNAGSAILLAPFVLLHGEPAKIMELSTTSEWKMHVFVVGSLVTGTFGFLLCVAGLLSIKVTSPVTHMFSSVRPCLSSPFVINFVIAPLGCSLRNTDASGGLAVSGCSDHVWHLLRCIVTQAHANMHCRNRTISLATILGGTMLAFHHRLLGRC